MSDKFDLEQDRETVRWVDGLFIGLLDEHELDALDRLITAGEAKRSYEGSAGFLGLAKARLSRKGGGDEQ